MPCQFVPEKGEKKCFGWLPSQRMRWEAIITENKEEMEGKLSFYSGIGITYFPFRRRPACAGEAFPKYCRDMRIRDVECFQKDSSFHWLHLIQNAGAF